MSCKYDIYMLSLLKNIYFFFIYSEETFLFAIIYVYCVMYAILDIAMVDA